MGCAVIGGADAAIVWGYLLDEEPTRGALAAAAIALGVAPDGPSLYDLVAAYDAAAWAGVERRGFSLGVERHGTRAHPTATAIGVVAASVGSKVGPALLARPEVYAREWRPIVERFGAALGLRGEVGALLAAAFHLVVST